MDKEKREEIKIPLKESLFLSPLEKYKLYGRFPWKMIIHIALVIATTTQAILMLSTTTTYSRAQERLLYNLFIDDGDKTDMDFKRFTYIFSVKDLRDHVNKSVQNYYDMRENSLQNITYPKDDGSLYITLEVNYIQKNISFYNHHDIKNNISYQNVYQINRYNLGPFEASDDNLKSYINNIVDFQLVYTFITEVSFYKYDKFECFKWIILHKYSYLHRAHFRSDLDIKRVYCLVSNNDQDIMNFFHKLVWIHLSVFFLAGISLILTWKYIYKVAKILGKVKKKFTLKKKNQSQKSDEEKIAGEIEINGRKENLFNLWSVSCLIGNIVQLFGAGLSIFDIDNVLTTTEILVGLGCMLAYINIGRYLEYNSDYSTIYQTIKKALPNVLRYVIGVLPIFFGYIFFGLCLFWRSDRFNSTSNAVVSLFAVLNGDSIFDTFNDLSGISFFVGQLYCYIFCLMFIVVVMNVFIAIIEEAYITIKMKNRNHWIYTYLKMNDKYEEIKQKSKHLTTSIHDEIKTPSRNHDELSKSKEQRKVLSEVASKNILRTILSLDKVDIKDNDNADSKFEKEKKKVDESLEKVFKKIEENVKELLKIGEDVSRLKDSEMKNEIMVFIYDSVNNVENKVVQIRNMISSVNRKV